MEIMKKITIILCVLIAVLSVPVFAAGQTEGMVEELRLGTASMGGAYFPVGQGISNLVSEYAEGLTMVPIVTEGGIQNPRLIDSKDVEFAITNIALSNSAKAGTAPYDKVMNIAAVASLYPSILHAFTLANSSINSFADLKGKRVAVGPAGGGTIQMLEEIFKVYGMTVKDITPSYLSYSDGFSQLADGNVDAAFGLSGYPAAAVMQTIATNKIKAIQIEKDKIKAILNAVPVYDEFVVAKDVYKLEADAVFLGQQNILITQADMSDEIVYSVVKALFENLPEFAATNSSAKQISIERAPKTVIPLHPGAAKYYAEK
jgi:TRAP transporter TAXI family solute receptor